MATKLTALRGRTAVRVKTDKAVRTGRGPLALSFVLPVFLMLLLFMIRDIYPFGNRSFLRTDLYNQYAPFFAELWRKLRGGESLFYSWNIGIGSNFVALYAYYLASPTNFLVALVSEKHIIEFMTYLIILKIGLSGLSFAWYLREHFDTKGSYAVTCFAVLYALSGYMAAYSWNIMWLDCIILAPLIILGLERLVKQGRCALYCVSLGFAILSNYYLSIMLCIFVVLYFFIFLIGSSHEERVTARWLGVTLGRFVLYSALAGGFAGVLLVPEIYALQMTKFSTISWPDTVKSYFSTIDVLSRHFINIDVELGLEHWPNLYCGVGVLFLIPLYMANKGIPWKEKMVKLTLAAVLLISYSNNVLNMIWHGMHYPNSLPARQSFLYIFLILTICFEALYRIEENTNREVALSFWGAIAIVLLCEKLVTEDFFDYDSVLITGLFLVLYGCIAFLLKKGARMRILAVSLGLVIVSVETAVNMAATSVVTTSRDSYLSDWEGTQELLEALEESDTDFYRIEKFSRRTKNDGSWLGYHGASLFSSVNNSSVEHFYKAVGMMGSKNSYAYFGATPLVSALLSVKYTLSQEPLHEPLRELVAESDGVYLYENKYVLPLGFMLPASMGENDAEEEEWAFDAGNPILVQNGMAEALGASGELLKLASCEVKGNKAGFEAEQDGYYYFYMGDIDEESITLSIKEGDGTVERKFSQTNREYLIDTGFVRAGSMVTITVKGADSIAPRLFYLDEQCVAEAVEKLGRQPLVVDSYDSTHIRGHIDVEEPGKLVLSVPWEDGWTLRLDGEKKETGRFADAFLCIELDKGSHELSLSYRPRGFVVGILISIGSIMAFAGIILCKRAGIKGCGCGRGLTVSCRNFLKRLK